MESLIFQASLNAISYNKSIIIEFQKIVSPLLVNFPVSYLMYHRFFKNGHYIDKITLGLVRFFIC